MTAALDAVAVRGAGAELGGRALRWSMRQLVAVTWASGAIFGAYILAFFGGTAVNGTAARWNESLPALHDAGAPVATAAIGAHFIAGGILLLLGPIQLMGGVRRAVPGLHRWLGRLYVMCAGFAGLGGLAYGLTTGTLGGTMMNLGFGTYGALMSLAAVLAYAHARARRYDQHRAWAIRLFALTVGSWLYRIEYGFWFLTMGRLGHTSHFTGWFDAVMVFFFYVPNLAVAELAIRSYRAQSNNGSLANGSRADGPLAYAATVVLLATAAFVIVATCSFTADYWWPGIVAGITGASL
ncbi:putative membrane protein DUF2306 [Nitrospirillum amazonense]|uniref:Putative membrane protein DUF2306 n=2 Tax=Nitrospirillum amazonense TaxID=28077 RepID=A0A560JIA3_9PROT|nr:putative membrane protein DUF2306 [Nitrospirillum amazonense]